MKPRRWKREVWKKRKLGKQHDAQRSRNQKGKNQFKKECPSCQAREDWASQLTVAVIETSFRGARVNLGSKKGMSKRFTVVA